MTQRLIVVMSILTGLMAGDAVAQQPKAPPGQQAYERAMKVYAVDVPASINLLVQAAKKGHVEAMVRLGYIYQTGPNIRQKDALIWYKKAVKAGNTAAIYEIGSIYAQGSRRVKQDYAAAIDWYQQGVSNKSVKCAAALSEIYASCEDPKFHDGEKALFLASALVKMDPDNPDFMDLLAAASARDLNFEQALKAASQAVNLSNLQEAPRRRELREQYQQGIPHPPIASDVWMLQAAENKNIWAVMKLARQANDELDNNYDPIMARHWYEVAAQSGNMEALLELGDLYFHGRGGNMDMNKAFWHFSEALEAGNDLAYRPLARMYLGGKGTRQSLEKALEYYTRSKEALGGSYTRMNAIKFLMRYPKSPEELYQQALEIIANDLPPKPGAKPRTFAQKTGDVFTRFWLAAEQGHPEAMREFADMNYYGKRYFVREGELDETSGGLNNNYARALDFYRQLERLGIESPEMEPCRELYLEELKERRKRERREKAKQDQKNEK